MALRGTLPRPSLGPPWTLVEVHWFVLGSLGVPQKQLKTNGLEHMALPQLSLDPGVTPDAPQMLPHRPQMSPPDGPSNNPMGLNIPQRVHMTPK